MRATELDDLMRRRMAQAMDLLARKLLEDESRIGLAFPYVTDLNGSWRTLPASLSAGYGPNGWSHGNWFGGFWVGLLVAAQIWTQDEKFLALAQERMQLVAQRADDGNTHDIGFIFISSALPLFHVTGSQTHRDLALRAADQLRRRLVTTPRGAYLASWGPLTDPRGRSSSAIDTMANLPLLYWAAGVSGDASYTLSGHAHAEMSRNFIRANYSTFHAVEYDPATGERVRGYTFQGWRDDSLWSRGQSWAVYGYAATAAATGMRVYLELAEQLAEHFLERLGTMAVPPYDFDDPDPMRPLDSAAGAVLASAMLDLAEIHPDRTRGAYWRVRALSMLDGLLTHCLVVDETHRGVLAHGCYSWPQKDGVDSAVMFGDWFFIEALCKVLLPGALRAQRPPLA